MSTRDIRYSEVDEEDLDALVQGVPCSDWRVYETAPSYVLGSRFGVVWELLGKDARIGKPLCIYVPKDGFARLVGRYASFREEFSPLSSWCYVCSVSGNVDSQLFRPQARGEAIAAWASLCIAEASLVGGQRVGNLRPSAILGTQSFAIGRSIFIGGETEIEHVIREWQLAQDVCGARGGGLRGGRVSLLRRALGHVWDALTAFTYEEGPARSVFVQALLDLHEADRGGSVGGSESVGQLFREVVPEAADLIGLESLSAERRLAVFDSYSRRARAISDGSSVERQALCFLAGYVATIVAGGEASLGLLREFERDLPEMTAWAFVTGSIHERVSWRAGFDGLGRYAARELIRSANVVDPPACDFALDEALILIDRSSDQPLGALRINAPRVVTVGLRPGLNIQVPVQDKDVAEPVERIPRNVDAAQRKAQDDQSRAVGAMLEVLSEALLPYLAEKLGREKGSAAEPRKGRRSK